MTDHLDAEVIKRLKTWPHTDWRGMLEAIALVFLEWGKINVERGASHLWGDPVWRIRLATGGWSGCEEAVYALAKSPPLENLLGVQPKGWSLDPRDPPREGLEALGGSVSKTQQAEDGSGSAAIAEVFDKDSKRWGALGKLQDQDDQELDSYWKEWRFLSKKRKKARE